MAEQSGQKIAKNIDSVFYTGNNTVPNFTPTNGVDTVVLANGDRYDWDGTQWCDGTGWAGGADVLHLGGSRIKQ